MGEKSIVTKGPDTSHAVRENRKVEAPTRDTPSFPISLTHPGMSGSSVRRCQLRPFRGGVMKNANSGNGQIFILT